MADVSALLVIDHLEVLAPRIKPDGIRCTYRVTRGAEVAETELGFSYGEPVFDGADSENLASLILAQVALNYGLFCKRITFHGRFDRVDVRFLTEAMENTSREIWVNKILVDNPFLTGDAAAIEPARLERYTQAAIDFPNVRDQAPWPGAEPDPRKVCVLSSGGKESLLSYGLLTEMGYEVHPLFGNESGRHWFTAVNAFRHFETDVPHTARVWISADRVFGFMLRQLPFIRKDFADVRADIYPVRLWTVAVFLFAMMPLVRKRGLGRIVIGCENDTTRRVRTHGIPHYDGLYDQSRFFDQALSRYFHRKQLPIAQFSLLRALSELTVQDTLAARYPALQAHQVSCHASHKDGERMRPCGKCEKCRRVVGILVAGGHDPKRCGYTEDQIERCLGALKVQGVHQRGPDAAHLLWKLAAKGAVEAGLGKEHPEVEQLRFDTERCPPDTLPEDIRAPFLRIMQQHTGGAVARSGRRWVPIDPLSPERLALPYPFGKRLPPAMSKTSYLWAEMSWPEAKERLSQVDVALLPVGAIEQHGPHLPLDVDTFDAEYLCRAVAARCDEPRPLVLPTIPYGVSYHHDEFPGTLSVSNETLARVVYDIGMAAARNGITKLLIVNGHGGNAPTLNHAAQMINRDSRIFVAVDTGESSDEEIYRDVVTPNDVHAGEVETSTTLAVRPELVDMSKAAPDIPRFSSKYLDFTGNEGVPWYAFTHRISESGVMGDPTKSSVKQGEAIWEIMIRHLHTFVEELRGMTLDEIFQRRY
ncbi:MAG: creatininase family protein [Rhodothermales bacterium]|nr:creatininase family protein [Rhodothermales bacterium]MBO6778110.1 creatininase family protein [Rhodothermales bacterium]